MVWGPRRFFLKFMMGYLNKHEVHILFFLLFKILLFFNFFNFYFLLFFPFIFISWKLITFQYCSGFCHTLT